MNSQKNLSLYQLTNEHEFLLSQLYDNETGEINKEVESKLMELDLTVEKKCLSVASYIRRMESDQAELDKLMLEIISRQRSYDNARKRLGGYLKENMERMGINELKCPYFKLKIKNNPYSTDVYDESKIPINFINFKIIEKRCWSKTLCGWTYR